MANEVKLETYTIRIRESGIRDRFLPISNFIKGNDFLSFFSDYIKSFDNKLERNDIQKRSLKLDSSSISFSTATRTISGIIESGDYGFASTIYNISSGEERYKRQIEDTEIKPFYFLLFLPKDDNKGYVLLQRLGVYGIHGIFKYHLNSFFKKKFPELQLEFAPFVSQKLAKKFITQGGIREFSLIRHNLPTDIADKLGMVGYEESIKSIEVVIKSKKNKFLPLNSKVQKFIDNPNARIFEIKELEKLGFDGNHKEKINVKFGKNNRTIDLSDNLQLRPYYDIDSKVKKNKDGHPVFNSIDSIAKEFIEDLMYELEDETIQ